MKKTILAIVLALSLLFSVSSVSNSKTRVITKYAKEHILIGKINVTKYCYGTKTSSDKKPYNGCIALSYDIRSSYKLKFGDKIYVDGQGYFIYDDWMPKHRWKMRCDIYTTNKKEAMRWGRVKKNVYIVKIRRSNIIDSR
jgi:3D (Asp-Asp-Asp) domain-containing protein